MKPAIEVRGLSKSYVINHKDRSSYHTIKDDFTNLLRSPFEKRDSHDEKFWALKDVNFDVMPGEIFGIIGQNGSGKSTLLKILSRIVDPTEGTVKIHGRVASLLEVGTGFHPELTGRENIYFNGSMLGMSRKEITRKFDEIVEFSEVEKFIDTPVKFYSSGMYVRLAFSVAAHLDPEILILDEVLAVGDANFQKKSLKKIQESMQNGTTVLFVSHSMPSVEKLCNKAMLLHKGKVQYLGETEFATAKYLAKNTKPAPSSQSFDDNPKLDAQFTSINILGNDGKPVEALDSGEKWGIKLNYVIKQSCKDTMVVCDILSPEGEVIYMTTDNDYNSKLQTLESGKYTSVIDMSSIELLPGAYYLRCSIQSPMKVVHDVKEDIPIKIRRDNKDIRSSYFNGKYMGYIASRMNWDIRKETLDV